MKLAVAMPLVLAAGCATERTGGDAVSAPTWVDDVAPVVETRCAGCHGAGDTPGGDYDLTGYLGALGGGSDAEANAIAGVAGSRLLTVLREPDDVHAEVADVLPLLERWVVTARLAYFDSALHPPGLLDPASTEFHGADLQRRGWDFALCQTCHGDDFAGGTADRSCLSCHQGDGGPTACDTCHDESTGAHPAHVAGGAAPCGECHVVPTRWDAPGHLDTAGPAEVTLGALAARDVVPPRRTEQPSYDPQTGTCSNVYCHGGVLGDAAALAPAPEWTGGAEQVACGGCHGAPPADHASDACAVCHDGAPHLDGVLDVGDGSGGCSACHGSAASAAPPRDLAGATATTGIGVGAHRAHRESQVLRGPVACADCHVVPTSIASAGHLDASLPAEVVGPTWDRAAGTCTTWCHGSAAPIWTVVGAEQAACGTCHGVPPADGFHAADLELSDCTTCHPSVTSGGYIIVSGPPDALTSEHMNGAVDLR